MPLAGLLPCDATGLAHRPKPPRRITVDGLHGFERQALRFAVEFHDAGHDQVQATACGARPDVSVAVLGDAVDPRIRGGDPLGNPVFQAEESGVAGADPERVVAIFEDGSDRDLFRQVRHMKKPAVFLQAHDFRADGKPEAGFACRSDMNVLVFEVTHLLECSVVDPAEPPFGLRGMIPRWPR